MGWNELVGHLIPKHANGITYLLGGGVVVLGLLQGITGILLQQFYHAHTAAPGAYESLQDIIAIPALAFVRSLHYWGAQFILAIVFLHLIRVFISGAYKKPREFQWLTGVGLLALAYAWSFTGTILKWDQEGVEALAHNNEVAEALGALGWPLPQFAHVPILERLYSLHVTLVPALVLIAIGIHLALIRILGISSPNIASKKGELTSHEEMVPFSTHLKRMLIFGGVLALTVGIISFVVQAPLGMRGVEDLEISKPPWYLLWIFPLEDAFGIAIVPYVTALFALSLIAVPFIDRKEETDPRRRRLMMAGLFTLLAIFIALMILGGIAPIERHI